MLDHQWRYGEHFWKACLDRGVISDVWLALADEVSSAARTIRDLRCAYGTLSGGVDSRHAVILMRVGPLVLCEWSHNGKLRAWPTDWRHEPQLGRRDYTGYELRTDGLVFPRVVRRTACATRDRRAAVGNTVPPRSCTSGPPSLTVSVYSPILCP